MEKRSGEKRQEQEARSHEEDQMLQVRGRLFPARGEILHIVIEFVMLKCGEEKPSCLRCTAIRDSVRIFPQIRGS